MQIPNPPSPQEPTGHVLHEGRVCDAATGPGGQGHLHPGGDGDRRPRVDAGQRHRDCHRGQR